MKKASQRMAVLRIKSKKYLSGVQGLYRCNPQRAGFEHVNSLFGVLSVEHRPWVGGVPLASLIIQKNHNILRLALIIQNCTITCHSLESRSTRFYYTISLVIETIANLGNRVKSGVKGPVFF